MSPGTLDAHCRCRDVRGGVCLKRSGAREVGCRRADVEVFASSAPEVWRSCRYVHEFVSRALEVWRCAASVLPLCLKSSGDALQACRRGGICLKSPRGLEAM